MSKFRRQLMMQEPPPIPLPYDAEVQYLECTTSTAGSFYVDTGFKPSTKTKIKLHVNVRGRTLQSRFFRTVDTFRIDFYINSSTAYAYNFNTSSNNATAYKSVSTGDTEIILDGKTKYLKVTVGETVKWEVNNITMASSYIESGNNLLLLGYSNGVGLQCYFYDCQIYEDDVLIRDYIPVRKDGVGYLYDKVEGLFYPNSGSGTFVIGNDK